MNVKIIKKIIEYGEKYIEKHLKSYNTGLMSEDWWSGLQFFLNHSFYQGRRDIISMRVEENAMNTLKEFIKRNNNDTFFLINPNNFSQIKNGLSSVIGRGMIGRGRDVNMVISILDFVSKLKEKNIIKYSISKIKNLKKFEN